MKKHTGFTLVELMITLAVAAILLTVGIPSFGDFIKNNRLVSYANEFVAGAHLARSEAIKRRRYGYICASSNQSSCTGGTNWAVGWIAWIDDNGDAIPQSTELLRARQALNATVTYTSNGPSQFRFDPTGISLVTGVFTMCDDRSGEQGRTINVSNSGRVGISPTPAACS
ncbi:MAG: GspH/FimT family pseudopilin [Gammaproteobacteria bacterium]|nr:GspH/FimT family pseudopilin [Gammaproteobacteria bacterium]